MRLFEPASFKTLSVRNRIVWLPMVSWEGTEDGFVTDRVVERYRRRAEGGAGLIIVEATAIHSGKSPFMLRAGADAHIPGLARIAEGIHGEGARGCLQLNHFLRSSRSGWKETVEDLSQDAIHLIVDQFVAAGARAREAGFDAIELHSGHSYSLSSFVSRLNQRKDDYGGSTAGRLRIVREIMRGLRSELGEGYCIGCRINGEDFVVGGNTLRQTRVIVRQLVEMGVSYVNVTAGGRSEDGPALTGYSGTRSVPPDYTPEAVNAYLAADLRAQIQGTGVPIIAVGHISTPETAESLLAEGKADLVGLARPLLCDPDWPKKHREGRGREVLKCIYCNECLARELRLEPAECATREKLEARQGRPTPAQVQEDSTR